MVFFLLNFYVGTFFWGFSVNRRQLAYMKVFLQDVENNTHCHDASDYLQGHCNYILPATSHPASCTYTWDNQRYCNVNVLLVICQELALVTEINFASVGVYRNIRL
jgi:hypothetical protein